MRLNIVRSKASLSLIHIFPNNRMPEYTEILRLFADGHAQVQVLVDGEYVTKVEGTYEADSQEQGFFIFTAAGYTAVSYTHLFCDILFLCRYSFIFLISFPVPILPLFSYFPSLFLACLYFWV